jgi:dihydroorotate dehydrogenase (NAD+) catalytic subunit
VQRWAGLRERRHSLLSVDMGVTLGSLSLKNPVVLASGTCGYGTEYSDLVDIGRLGGIVSKGLTVHKKNGNVPPRIAETPCGMLNSVGLENVGLDSFIEEKLEAMRELDTRVFVNVAGSTIDDYVRVVSGLEGKEGIDAFELNVSCPNVENGIIFGASPTLIHRLVSLVRKETILPLFVKLSPNIDRILEVASSAVEAGADGLSLINTLHGMVIDVERRRPVLGNETGGLSGPAIRPVAVYYVRLVSCSVAVPIIGMGGIMTWRDAMEFILAGALAVQVGTALFSDPGSPVAIVEGLEDYCQRHGVEKIADLVGGIDAS